MSMYLGVHRFSPKVVVKADTAWQDFTVKINLNMLRYWKKLITMDCDRLTKQVFEKDYEDASTIKNGSEQS